jgi:glycosyltransferase involved in cell wall biosynthesis
VRVLFVNPGRDLGGAERSLLLLLRGLATRGVEPTVALFGHGALEIELQRLGISTVTVAPAGRVDRTSRYDLPRSVLVSAPLALRSLPAVRRLATAARRADLVHTNGLKAHLLGGLAGRLARRPVVWHVRDFPPDGHMGRVFRCAARLLPSAALTNSQAVAAAVRRAGVPDRVLLEAIPNPVDLERFRPGLARDRVRGQLGIPVDTPLIGMVAHLTPWKGHEPFLEIAHALRRTQPAARFVVLGGPIYTTTGHADYLLLLRARAVELGVADVVSFLGARDDVPDVLTDLDVLVHCPTEPEPSGRVVAEAMAVGRAVVVARSGGVPEQVEHGVTGLLVPPGDVQAFAAAVERLLRDPALRERLGTAGRDAVAARCSIESHAERVMSVYEHLRRGETSTHL